MPRPPYTGKVAASTRDLYFLNARFQQNDIAADMVAWTRMRVPGTPFQPLMRARLGDDVEINWMRSAFLSGMQCLTSDLPDNVRYDVLAHRLEALHETACRYYERTKSDWWWEARARTTAYAAEMGMSDVLPQFREHALDYAEHAEPGSPIHGLAYGLHRMTEDHIAWDVWTPGIPNGVRAQALALGCAALGIPETDAVVVPEGPEDEPVEDTVAEDRGGILRTHRDKAAEQVAAPKGTVVVLRELGGLGKTDSVKQTEKALNGIVGAEVPLVAFPSDPAEFQRRMDVRSPHGSPVTQGILAAQAGREYWGWDPVLIVGSPGAGKNAYVRALGEMSGRPVGYFPADASQDASFSGTPARWMSSHPSQILAWLAQLKVANLIAHVDELEKAAGSRESNSGRIVDCLTGMLERTTAAAWYDQFVMAKCDFSHVQFIITVNETKGIPSHILDRLRIVRFPDPGPEHLGVLAPQVARQVCVDLNMDPRWGTLDGEEYAAVEAAWKGGSIRQLQKFVAAAIRARDTSPAPRH